MNIIKKVRVFNDLSVFIGVDIRKKTAVRQGFMV